MNSSGGHTGPPLRKNPVGADRRVGPTFLPYESSRQNKR